jgi:pyruvate dehydrogenase (quinone)
MKGNVSDFIVSRLAKWGVKRIFGFPGDSINGILGALNRATGKINFIQVRHEETTALMACAHAKFTEVGVCLASSGPGAIHLLNGLYDARLDHQPMAAIVGQAKRASLGGGFQQEVNLISLFKDVAREYVHMASTPAQMRHLIDRAMRIAQVERNVCRIIVPSDIQEMDAEKPPRKQAVPHDIRCSCRRTTSPHRFPPAIAGLDEYDSLSSMNHLMSRNACLPTSAAI